MIHGLILAGCRAEYSHYLFKHHLKERDYPQLTLFNQLHGYHETPPIVCIGTYYKSEKYKEIRQRAVIAGAEVTEEKS